MFPSSDNNGPGRATVVYKVVIDWGNTGFLRTFSEVADVWHGNTDDLFCAHPVATASTRAEGRALRKALKIRVIAAEELAKKDIVGIVKEAVSASSPTDGEYNLDDRISPQQVTFIDKKCGQLDINLASFINIGSGNYRSINDVLLQQTMGECLRSLMWILKLICSSSLLTSKKFLARSSAGSVVVRT